MVTTRSLRRHAADINKRKILIKTEILCLTESQISANDDTSDVCEELRTFVNDFNSCGQKFENLAIENIDKSKNFVQHQKFPSISLLDIRKTSFSPDPISVMLLYRSPSSHFKSLYNNLQSLFSSDKVIDIIWVILMQIF